MGGRMGTDKVCVMMVQPATEVLAPGPSPSTQDSKGGVLVSLLLASLQFLQLAQTGRVENESVKNGWPLSHPLHHRAWCQS